MLFSFILMNFTQIQRHNMTWLYLTRNVCEKGQQSLSEWIVWIFCISKRCLRFIHSSEISITCVSNCSSMQEFTFRLKVSSFKSKISTGGKANALPNWWRFHDLCIKNQCFIEQIFKSSISCIKSSSDKILSLFSN